jgi:micrococcal nuclease
MVWAKQSTIIRDSMNFTRRNLLLIRSILVLVVLMGVGISRLIFTNTDERAVRSTDAEKPQAPRSSESPSSKIREAQAPTVKNVAVIGRISVFCFDVADGDTLRLKDSQGKNIKLRMKGIDAPEFRPLQAYGAESRQAMIDKVKGKQIEVLLVSKDQYDRDLGIVYYQGVNLNEEQIRLGNAWSYAYKRDPEYARMRDLEQEARLAKRGLWALPDPQNPREFRDSHPKN